MSQFGHPLRIRRVRGLQVEQEPEAIEVSSDILVVWIPFLKRQLSEKLSLSGRFESRREGGNPDLRTFRIKIAAKTLEVGAQVQHEASKCFIEKRRVRRNKRQN